MTNHVLLNNVTHKDLRVNVQYQKGGPFDVSVARVFAVEFGQLQVEYPLFFMKNKDSGHFETIALLGFAEDENLYLNESGWDAAYLPMTIERQPFLIGFQEQDQDGVPVQVPVVHVDMEHPSISDTDGQRVFLEHVGESPYLERTSAVLMTIHEGAQSSDSFSQLLVGLELIESLVVDIELADGTRQGLAGLHTINEDKLKTLNADGLQTLHRQGYLQSVYMMLASLPNMQRLIDRKNKLLSV